eukprot:TRINITY_DN3141_c0_g1_i1.p3 TRINITY_DN3141_c0_g1~~TRINITY_DN3141_c0_g1_i1.p3  ORF type:complete len:243 (-),score=-12.33 TRINITY_DN3141_c0_g1_i1:2054-2782(-)
MIFQLQRFGPLTYFLHNSTSQNYQTMLSKYQKNCKLSEIIVQKFQQFQRIITIIIQAILQLLHPIFLPREKLNYQCMTKQLTRSKKQTPPSFKTIKKTTELKQLYQSMYNQSFLSNQKKHIIISSYKFTSQIRNQKLNQKSFDCQPKQGSKCKMLASKHKPFLEPQRYWCKLSAQQQHSKLLIEKLAFIYTLQKQLQAQLNSGKQQIQKSNLLPLIIAQQTKQTKKQIPKQQPKQISNMNLD